MEILDGVLSQTGRDKNASIVPPVVYSVAWETIVKLS